MASPTIPPPPPAPIPLRFPESNRPRRWATSNTVGRGDVADKRPCPDSIKKIAAKSPVGSISSIQSTHKKGTAVAIQEVWGPCVPLPHGRHDPKLLLFAYCSSLQNDSSPRVIALRRLGDLYDCIDRFTIYQFHHHMHLLPSHLEPCFDTLKDALARLLVDDPSLGGMGYELLLEAGIFCGHLHWVELALSVKTWTPSGISQVPDLLALPGDYRLQVIFPVVMADPRFTLAIQSRLFALSVSDVDLPAIRDYSDAVLQNPHTQRSMIWGDMLRSICDYPAFPAGHFSRSMQSGQWQFVHLDAAPNVAPSNWVMPSTLRANPCPKLLVELPYDIQLYLGPFLNAPSVARLRSTCHELSQFPMDDFVHDRLERALRHSSNQQSGTSYDPITMRKFIDEVAKGQGPSTLHYRPFIEAVRHLDVKLATCYLQPTSPAVAALYDPRQCPNPALVYYVYPWALYTLLYHSPVSRPGATQEQRQSARLILTCILIHSRLPLLAWYLVVLASSTVHRILSNTKPIGLTHGQGPLSMAVRLLHIVQSGTLRLASSDDKDRARFLKSINLHLTILLVYVYGNVDALHTIVPALRDPATQLVSALDYLNNVKDVRAHLSLPMVRAVYAIVHYGNPAWAAEAVWKYSLKVATRGGTDELLMDVICGSMDEQDHLWRMVEQVSEKGAWQAQLWVKALCVLIVEFPKWKMGLKAKAKAGQVDARQVKDKVAQCVIMLGSHVERVSRVCGESDFGKQAEEMAAKLAVLHGLWKPIRRKLDKKWDLVGKTRVRVEKVFGLDLRKRSVGEHLVVGKSSSSN